jgi:hypothetical protein
MIPARAAVFSKLNGGSWRSCYQHHDTSPPAGPKRYSNARISRSSGLTETVQPGRSGSTGTVPPASCTSNAAPLDAYTAATALSLPVLSSISSASTIRISPTALRA